MLGRQDDCGNDGSDVQELGEEAAAGRGVGAEGDGLCDASREVREPVQCAAVLQRLVGPVQPEGVMKGGVKGALRDVAYALKGALRRVLKVSLTP